MWVATQVRHTDWTMIARVYGRWMPEADDAAGRRAETAFDKESKAGASGAGNG